MVVSQPQTLKIVSCTILPKPDANPRDEMTEFHVTVRIGEHGVPFRLRTDRGMPLKPLYFGAGATVTWITELLAEGAEISAPIAMIAGRWQDSASGFLKGDRAVNPKEIKPVGRKISTAPSVTASTPHTTPVPGTFLYNEGDKMGERAV